MTDTSDYNNQSISLSDENANANESANQPITSNDPTSDSQNESTINIIESEPTEPQINNEESPNETQKIDDQDSISHNDTQNINEDAKESSSNYEPSPSVPDNKEVNSSEIIANLEQYEREVISNNPIINNDINEEGSNIFTGDKNNSIENTPISNTDTNVFEHSENKNENDTYEIYKQPNEVNNLTLSGHDDETDIAPIVLTVSEAAKIISTPFIVENNSNNVATAEKNIAPRQAFPISLVEGAYLAALAYKSPKTVYDAYKGLGNINDIQCLKSAVEMPIYYYDPSTDTQAYMLVLKDIDDNKQAILLVRGTNSLIDVICDLQVNLTKFKTSYSCDVNVPDDVMIHSGFLKQYEALEPLIKHDLERLMYNTNNTLLCIGHSLGNICSLAALVYSVKYPDRVRYLGYGSPRIGNLAFTNFFKKCMPDPTTYQLVKNGSDPICGMMTGDAYKHICEFYHCGKVDLHPTVPLMTDIFDHSQQEYINNLENNPDIQPTWFEHIIRLLTQSIAILINLF